MFKLFKKEKQPLPIEKDKPAIDSGLPKVSKKFTRRAFLLVIFGMILLIGAGLIIIYMVTTNLVMGFIAVPLLFGGGIGFYYYWNLPKDLHVKYIGDIPKEQVNSLIIFPGMLKFANIAKPEGFVWYWIDDGKPYYLYWENPKTNKLEPFNLPDQQYYDPRVFAEVVLTLPCHRKLFTHKQDLIKKLRPLFAAVIGLGIWILILTTTGKPG